MTTSAETDDGVPLAHYRQHEGCGVRFHCEPCAYGFSAPVEAVIQRLERRRVGDAQTGVRAVGRLSRRPCPRCGALRWETRPDFPPGGGRGL